MTPAVERPEHHRRLLVALTLALLALVVGFGASVDAHASTPVAPVTGNGVAAHDHPDETVVAAADGVLAGESRRTTTPAADHATGSRVAPQATTGLADDVVATADDAFAHGYRYDPRIRARGLQDPTGHNFPYSFDDVILRSTPVRQADGSLLYRAPGSIWGKDGFFEIAVNTDTGTIFHRTYVGG